MAEMSADKLKKAMRHVRPLPSQEFLRDLFDYSPETGELRWRNTRKWGWNGRIAGWGEAGYYLKVTFKRRHFYAHRIIWKWMSGDDPRTVDHIDQDKTNNKWSNLRECSLSENLANVGCRRHNASGDKGVDWEQSRLRWRAQIAKDGRHYMLGRFIRKEDAIAAYAAKAKELYGEFARVA